MSLMSDLLGICALMRNDKWNGMGWLYKQQIVWNEFIITVYESNNYHCENRHVELEDLHTHIFWIFFLLV